MNRFLENGYEIIDDKIREENKMNKIFNYNGTVIEAIEEISNTGKEKDLILSELYSIITYSIIEHNKEKIEQLELDRQDEILDNILSIDFYDIIDMETDKVLNIINYL